MKREDAKGRKGTKRALGVGRIRPRWPGPFRAGPHAEPVEACRTSPCGGPARAEKLTANA
ncbi:MAG: hypothetical protein HYX78_10315 [Armatimonadetes bacterium]|nr:hypothetical protein [Armatimonadota bacterium]